MSLLGAAAGLTGTLALLTTYTLAVEPYLLEVTHPDIECPRLPASLDGLTILLLTDPHVGKWGRREPKLLALLEKVERPEMIVWGGDFIQGAQGVRHALELCRRVHHELFPGVSSYAILGNAEHKIRIDVRRRMVEVMEGLGLTVLENRHILVRPRPSSDEIVIGGTDDPYYGYADMAATLKGAPVAERFTLLLAHSPQVAVEAARAGVDLMLSGHTHGGQVRLPLIGPVKTQNPLCRRMDMGLWDRESLARELGRDPGGDTLTYISRGIGVATVPRFPILAPRLLCRPEVTRITLHRPETVKGLNVPREEDKVAP